ncbi:hypothetical protein CVT24_004099 [Panaeolus cyanescens]|uniref:BTB domain-containing protein n=1 Tax=Panaeolus cyanescens TaxID=181874 RepID=A0A409Y5Y8_9AGAR|nr:hypothetical protein CVT24_004099 [Panaeolus cyanescens]
MQLETDHNYSTSHNDIDVDRLKYHPEFSSQEADVILASKDAKVYFRVPSFTLRTTSGFFQTMFSLPQSDTSPPNIIYLDEDADILECLLRMLCGFAFPDIVSHDTLESLAYAAEKYDMAGPLSLIRMYIMTTTLSDPIRLYAIACRHGWIQEAKELSRRTLSMNIYDQTHRSTLRALSSDAMLNLFVLHRSRKDELEKALNSPPFVSGGASTCIECHHPIVDYTWKLLKGKMLAEMDKRPLGDTILDEGLSSWPEAISCWKATCPNQPCRRLLFDRSETIRVIKNCIKELKDTV